MFFAAEWMVLSSHFTVNLYVTLDSGSEYIAWVTGELPHAHGLNP